MPLIMRSIGTYAFLLGLVLGLASCSNESEIVDQEDLNYFPLQQGASWVYQVDSIWVDCLSDRFDTIRFQIKEVMEAWVEGANGDSLMRIAHYRRADSNSSWGPPRIWTARRTPLQAIRTEENRSLVKLSFPVELEKTWDGHAYLSEPSQEWKYQEVDAPLDSLNRTVLVVQQSEENLLEKKLFSERYAFSMGLVHAIKIDVVGIVTDPNDPNDCEEYLPPSVPWNNLPILERVKFGYIYEMQLLSFDSGL